MTEVCDIARQSIPRMRWVVPTEQGEIVIEFENSEFRVFSTRIAEREKGYSFLKFPNMMKAFRHTAEEVVWKGGYSLDFKYLYEKSTPVTKIDICRYHLRVEYRNQAPTAVHPTHHVYAVYLYPFNPNQPFNAGESIAGGHAERGGSQSYSVEELLAWTGWKEHFELSGCGWAITIVESNTDDIDLLLCMLTSAICQHNYRN